MSLPALKLVMYQNATPVVRTILDDLGRHGGQGLLKHYQLIGTDARVRGELRQFFIDTGSSDELLLKLMVLLSIFKKMIEFEELGSVTSARVYQLRRHLEFKGFNDCFVESPVHYAIPDSEEFAALKGKRQSQIFDDTH